MMKRKVRSRGAARSARRPVTAEVADSSPAGTASLIVPAAERENLIKVAIARSSLRRATARDRRLLTLYGLTEVEYDKVLEHQGGRCAICGGPRKKLRLAVDHDHATGEARGLVCWRCNKALAYLADDPTRARSATDYLTIPPVRVALGGPRFGRVGRACRKWRTRRERAETLKRVADRLSELGYY